MPDWRGTPARELLAAAAGRRRRIWRLCVRRSSITRPDRNPILIKLLRGLVRLLLEPDRHAVMIMLKPPTSRVGVGEGVAVARKTHANPGFGAILTP